MNITLMESIDSEQPILHCDYNTGAPVAISRALLSHSSLYSIPLLHQPGIVILQYVFTESLISMMQKIRQKVQVAEVVILSLNLAMSCVILQEEDVVDIAAK